MPAAPGALRPTQRVPGLRRHIWLSPQGFEYQPQSGQCCGLCVQQACVVNSSNNSTHLFYVSSGGGAWLGGPRAVEGVLG